MIFISKIVKRTFIMIWVESLFERRHCAPLKLTTEQALFASSRVSLVNIGRPSYGSLSYFVWNIL